MMSPKFVIFFAFSYVSATLLCLFIEGGWFGAEELDIMNALTGMSLLEITGTGAWTIPKLISGFFTVGVPRLLLWDYSFLDTPEGGLFKWLLLLPLSVGFVWGLAVVFLSAISGIFVRR